MRLYSGGLQRLQVSLEASHFVKRGGKGTVASKSAFDGPAVFRRQLIIGICVDQFPVAGLQRGHRFHFACLCFRRGRTFEPSMMSSMARRARLIRLITVPIGTSITALASAYVSPRMSIKQITSRS